LDVWPARQARHAAVACSRSSALLNLRRGCLGGWLATGGLSLRFSTPCRRMRLRLAIRDQFTRPAITHFLATQQSRRGMREKPAALPQRPNDFRCREPSSGLSNRRANRERHTPPVRRGNYRPALCGLVQGHFSAKSQIVSTSIDTTRECLVNPRGFFFHRTQVPKSMKR